MPTARGRDGPATKERCRGSRIGAPSPAPDDQPQTGSETASVYGKPSKNGTTTPAGRGNGRDSFPSSSCRLCRGTGSGRVDGPRRRRAHSFRGELKLSFRSDGGARLRWYLASLSGSDSDDPPAAATPVLQPLVPCPLAGGAMAAVEAPAKVATAMG